MTQISPTLPARRVRRPSLAPEQFLEQAFELFVQTGYEGTSIDMIAAQVGIAKRTFYQKYGDKETLFRAAMQHAIRAWILPVERLQQLETRSLDATLLAIGEALVENILSPAGMRLMRLTNAVSVRMPEIGAFNVKLGTEPTIRHIADLLHRHLPLTGEQAGDAAELFLNLVVGGPASAAAWGVQADPAQVSRRTAASVRVFLHGLVRDSTTSESALAAENATLRLALTEAGAGLAEWSRRIDQTLVAATRLADRAKAP